MQKTWIEEQFEQCVQQRVLKQVSTVSEIFSMIYSWKISKNGFPQPLSTLPKFFYPVAQTKKTELGFVMPTGMPEKGIDSVSGYARAYKCGLAILYSTNCFFLKKDLCFMHLLWISEEFTWKILERCGFFSELNRKSEFPQNSLLW